MLSHTTIGPWYAFTHSIFSFILTANNTFKNLNMASTQFPNLHKEIIEYEHMKILLGVPVEGFFSLEDLLLLYQNFISIFSNDMVRERCLSSKTTVSTIISATGKALSLLDAARSTYFNAEPSSPLNSEKQHLQPPGLVCVESTVSVSRNVLNKEEGDLVVRNVIKSSILRLGREVTNLKRRLYEHSGLGEQEAFEMDEVEQTLSRIWALVAAMREQ